MSIKKLHKIAAWVESQAHGREDLILAINMAILCKEHVLVVGPPGIAKSMVVDLYMSCVTSLLRNVTDLARYFCCRA